MIICLLCFFWMLLSIGILVSIMRAVFQKHRTLIPDFNNALGIYTVALFLSGGILLVPGLQQLLTLLSVWQHTAGVITTAVMLQKAAAYSVISLVAFLMAMICGWLWTVGFFPGRSELREAENNNIAYYLFKGASVVVTSLLLFILVDTIDNLLLPALPVQMIH